MMDYDVKKLIQCFRRRLRQLISVEPVLDGLTFLSEEQKEVIRARFRNEGQIKAADLLLGEVLNQDYPSGWERELITALELGGCKQAANYVANNLPTPSMEAENDTYIRLLSLLNLTLMEMKTTDVCESCYQKNILTAEDRQVILAENGRLGPIAGVRELLSRLTKNEHGWFSQFLEALKETEHGELARELLGEPDESNKAESAEVVDNPQPLVDESVLAVQDDGKLKQATVDTSSSETSTTVTSDASQDTPANLVSGIMELDLYKDPDSEMKSEEAAKDSTQSGNEHDIVLRDYQMEVAKPALDGKNIIICLPTGSGKTRVAVYITKQHLENNRLKEQPAKVIVLVNKVPLVEQHYQAEFGKFLRHQYNVERVSGDSQLKISFPQVIEKNDIIICTAQILENSLGKAKQNKDEGIELSQFTLMVIDECHHTQKGGVYNNIMTRYLKEKNKNSTRQKEGKKLIPLPQILGLTASPGVGGAKNQDKAEEHILRICANLDAYTIMTKPDGLETKGPYKQIASAQKRNEDPFGDVIKGIMSEIHTHAQLNPLCQPGTQNYEQWAVQKEQNAAKENNQTVRVCAEHLRQYNEALHQSNTIRMSDAFKFLNKYNEEELKKKRNAEDEPPVQITDTERFLFQLFTDKKERLEMLMKNPAYENNNLAKLKSIILEEFTSRVKARGIIFTKTRNSAISLSQWIQENPKFDDVGIKAAHLIGGGDQSLVKPMTAADQKKVLNKFYTGEINLLVATTVAEEGLDISACNCVIRYGLVTNEIAMIQARGRGRADDSSYTVVAEVGSGVAERESVNEYREKMMNKAIAKVCSLKREDYEEKIKENQLQTILEERVKTKKKQQKGMIKESPSKVTLSCKKCNIHVCSGEDIEVIEKMHHVNLNSSFSELYTVRENVSLQQRNLDYEANGVIACKKCGQSWGSMMLFKSIECPCLHIKNFLVTYNSKNKTFSKWNELAIAFPSFNYAYHATLQTQTSDDDMEEAD